MTEEKKVPEAKPKKDGLPWWRFWPLFFICFAVAYYIGKENGKLQERTGNQDAIILMKEERNEIAEKWYSRKPYNRESMREFLRDYMDRRH